MGSKRTSEDFRPLAARFRPRTLAEFIGQKHLLAAGKPLYQAIQNKLAHSMIFWGPPGTGKTTLAHLLADNAAATWETLSAVTAGVKDIREVLERARLRREQENKKTVLFVDEVHRFNKAQQDAFLPAVEEGKIVLIGATTENPSFELNNALLSRLRVYVLKRLTTDDLEEVLKRALADSERGLGERAVVLPDKVRRMLAELADGDARQALNLLELCADFAEESEQGFLISEKVLSEVAGSNLRRFDKGGEYFYDQISALHKSVRGSNPNAALYWFCRMVDGGCAPEYLARRIVRMATEDIGNADPNGLRLALDAWDTYLRLGSPEGELALAQAIIYLAVAPKSNAAYVAYGEARADVEKYGTLEVPIHLRNAPTKLMKNLGYGKEYRYAHDEEHGYAAGEKYFPEGMPEGDYYRPLPHGLEIKIAEKLAKLRAMDETARKK